MSGRGFRVRSHTTVHIKTFYHTDVDQVVDEFNIFITNDSIIRHKDTVLLKANRRIRIYYPKLKWKIFWRITIMSPGTQPKMCCL